MNSRLLYLFAILALVSCKNSDGSDDPHHDWESRNAQWFAEMYETAQSAISAAKAQYSEDWEAHCDWRLYRTLQKSQDVQGPTTDYIVCKILERGDGTASPNFTDSVNVYYRAWLMDERYPERKDCMTVFSQSYYGAFDENYAAPLGMPVTSTVEGFQTALQFMSPGSNWLIYIPQQMAYGEKASDAIPAYSTLLYELRLANIIRR